MSADWNGQPAIGVIVAKLVELNLRALRVDAKRRDDRAKRVLELARKMKP